jgi:hypothetical protein
MAWSANLLTNPSAGTQDLTGWSSGKEISKITTTDYDWTTCKELSGLSVSGGELILIV